MAYAEDLDFLGCRILCGGGHFPRAKFTDPATTRPPFPLSGASAAGAEEALASITHEMIEAQLFRQMAVDSSSPNP
jgi:hypothetical protein